MTTVGIGRQRNGNFGRIRRTEEQYIKAMIYDNRNQNSTCTTVGRGRLLEPFAKINFDKFTIFTNWKTVDYLLMNSLSRSHTR